jgi:hypothetical protein
MGEMGHFWLCVSLVAKWLVGIQSQYVDILCQCSKYDLFGASQDSYFKNARISNFHEISKKLNLATLPSLEAQLNYLTY